MAALSRAPRRVLECARHRFSRRSVAISSPLSRGGNLLYSWAWAHTESAKNPARPHRVLLNSHAAPWLGEFPSLLSLSLPSDDLAFMDERITGSLYGFNDPLTGPDLASFSREHLCTSPTFTPRLERARSALGADALVINVRRGDYYENPEFQRRYGIDIRRHVREALALLGHPEGTRPSAFIVSDDVAWCQENLGDLAALEAPFPGADHSMFNDLAVLASAKHLVLANSTFSYWGNFISRATNTGQIAIATDGHEIRDADGSLVDSLLDPAWPRTSVRPGTVPPER